MKITLSILILLSIATISFSQEISSASDTIRKDALNVYMSSASSFIRREITFINYVRDLRDADVYIITTYEETGSGGEQYKYFLVGQNRFAGMNDTVVVMASPDETSDLIRRNQVNSLKMGLMRYILKTPLSKYFDIRFTQPVKETINTDKWNSWVFRTSMSGSLQGERRYKSESLSGSTSANRVTEKSKLQTYASFSWSNQRYELNDSVFSDHWSAGFSSSISASSYGSYDLRLIFAPAIEYNIFPYSESTRRQFRIVYSPGYSYYDYSDTTIYNKVTQHLGFHKISATYEVVQKWGSADFSLSWSNYFYNWSKNNFGADMYLSFRIAKGLNLNYSGYATIVNDQLSLPKAGVSDTDILLRRKMTETKFTYYSYFGISYTFGSIYNNVVNPRFGW
jgi:hypothetical protein